MTNQPKITTLFSRGNYLRVGDDVLNSKGTKFGKITKINATDYPFVFNIIGRKYEIKSGGWILNSTENNETLLSTLIFREGVVFYDE